MAEGEPLTLFEAVDYTQGKDYLAPDRNLKQVLLNMISAASGDWKDITPLMFHPSRLVHIVTDYKISHPRAQVPIALVQRATDLALSFQALDFDSVPEAARDFIGAATNYPKLLDSSPGASILELIWHESFPDWYIRDHEGPDPNESTKRLLRYTNERPILLLPIGTSGYLAGLDLLVRYRHLTGNQSSQVYPIRFSFYRYGDKKPRLTVEEKKHLAELTTTLTPVVFDTLSIHGKTLAALYPTTLEIFGESPFFHLNRYDAIGHLIDLDDETIKGIKFGPERILQFKHRVAPFRDRLTF